MAEEEKKDEQEKQPEAEKKVDSDWKKQAQAEKQAAAEKQEEKEAERVPLPPPEFGTFINSLAVQALMSMGQIENPVTKQETVDLDQAKYTIDILGMIEEKTKGNLSAEEKKLLDQILYDLRMRYVAAVGG